MFSFNNFVLYVHWFSDVCLGKKSGNVGKANRKIEVDCKADKNFSDPKKAILAFSKLTHGPCHLPGGGCPISKEGSDPTATEPFPRPTARRGGIKKGPRNPSPPEIWKRGLVAICINPPPPGDFSPPLTFWPSKTGTPPPGGSQRKAPAPLPVGTSLTLLNPASTCRVKACRPLSPSRDPPGPPKGKVT